MGKLENFITLLCFANGVGKTSIVFALLGAVMWGAPTSAFDYPLYTNYPDRWPKRIRIVTESSLVSDDGPVQVESAKWWPKGRYTWIRGGKQYNKFFYTDTGFMGEVMTYEQQLKEFEGKTVGINVFIEPPPREIFNASVARQRMGGLNIFDMTPLMSAAWVLDEIVSKPEIIVEGNVVGRARVIHADIEANCRQHGKNGQLEHNDIMQIISRYDPDELAARAHGQFMHLSGRIWKGFDRSVHVAKEPITPKNGEWLHVQVNDPAIGKPLALLWAQADPSGYIEIYDESPNFDFHGSKDSNLSVSDYVTHFKAKEEGRVIGLRILDRHFGNARRTLGGKTLKEEFLETGESMGYPVEYVDSYHVGDNQSEVETGILRVKEFLKYDKTKPLDCLNRPKILISPTCTNTISAIERWGRDPKTFKPKEEYKDFADLVRMLVMAEPKYEAGSEWSFRGAPHYGVGNV